MTALRRPDTAAAGEQGLMLPAAAARFPWSEPCVDEIALTWVQARRMVAEAPEVMTVVWADEARTRIALLLSIAKREMLRRLAFSERHGNPLPPLRRPFIGGGLLDILWVG